MYKFNKKQTHPKFEASPLLYYLFEARLKVALQIVYYKISNSDRV